MVELLLPFVVAGVEVVVLVVATLFEDLRFDPTKLRKRWFMDDMNSCGRKEEMWNGDW